MTGTKGKIKMTRELFYNILAVCFIFDITKSVASVIVDGAIGLGRLVIAEVKARKGIE